MILGASIPKDRSRGFLIGCNQGIELLMICQSSKVHMKSVEFQRELFEVTQYNTEKSKFHDRVTLKFGELRQGFQEKDKGEFDLVVSNPFHLVENRKQLSLITTWNFMTYLTLLSSF